MVEISRELYEFIIKIVDDRVSDIRVTREEFDKLSSIVRELAEAQRRTEERLNELIEAQRRTEERLNILAKRVDELAEAQRRTEERLNELAEAQRKTEGRLKELAEAQRRTEDRLNTLAEAQRITEERLNELARAQLRTEERLNILAKRVDELVDAQRNNEVMLSRLIQAIDLLRQEVGRLSEAYGFGLEDIARVVLPGWIYRHLQLEVELERRIININGRKIELDLYGETVKNGRRIVVIGEVKSRIYKTDVNRFYTRKYRPLVKNLDGTIIGILFGYIIYPEASERAKELGLYTVASYMR